VEGRDLMVVAIADEDDACDRLGLAGHRAGRDTQVPAHVGEDDAVVELARLEHRVLNRAARVDGVEDLLMAGGDGLAGVQLAADRDEVGVGCERCAEGRPIGSVPGVLQRLIRVSAVVLGSMRTSRLCIARGSFV